LLRWRRLLLTSTARHPDMSDSPIARRDLVALVLAATCWGVGTVISKAALDEISPFTLLPIQLAASLTLLAVLMRRQGISFRTEGSPLLGRLGLLNPGLAYALGLIGLTTITASLYVLLWSLEPLMILFLAAWFLRERITPAFIVLSMVAVAGMVVIVYDPSSSSGHLIGVGLTLAGIACCAVYSVVARRFIPGARETSQVILAQQAHALVLALALVCVVGLAGGQIIPATLTPFGFASAIASGALYYAGAYWFYLGALRHVPASYAAVSFYLIPIVGVAAGALLLGERLDLRQWLGAVIVLGAVLAIIRQPTTAAAVETSATAAS
jgi:probable blue pigment (indigoidine) exporter